MGVTAVLTGFTALSEFWTYRDTCGEDAFLVLEHCKDGRTLDGPAVDAVRNDMQAKGYGVNGTVMSQLVDYFRRHRGLDCVETNPYGSSWDAIHQTLLDHAGRDGVVIEVELAYELTGNEQGVRRHYVAIGGIHPTRGYLVANGDDVLALNVNHGHGKTYPPRWMGKDVLERARPSACAIVRGLPHTVEQPAPAPQPAPQPAPAPQPVYFDAANIAAFRDELVQSIQAANATLATLQKALASLPQQPAMGG